MIMDLGTTMNSIHGVVMMIRGPPNTHNTYVKAVSISLSYDGVSFFWPNCTDYGEDTAYPVFSEYPATENERARAVFNPAQEGRHVRIHVRAWYRRIAMRAAVLVSGIGVTESGEATYGEKNVEPCGPANWVNKCQTLDVPESQRTYKDMEWFGRTTVNNAPTMYKNGAFYPNWADSRLSSQGAWIYDTGGKSRQEWHTSVSTYEVYLEIDVGKVIEFGGLIIEGQYDAPENYVSMVYITIRSGGGGWLSRVEKRGVVYPAVQQAGVPAEVKFSNAKTTRYLRIYPVCSISAFNIVMYVV